MAALACLFVIELVAISIWIDNEVLRGSSGLTRLISHWGAWAVRLGVAIAFVALIFGESKSQRGESKSQRGESKARSELLRISAASSMRGVAWPLLAGHFGVMGGFVWLSSLVFVNRVGSANVLAAVWILTGILAIAAAACALIPLSTWSELIRSVGDGLVYALLAGLIACVLGEFAWKLWTPLSRWTFLLVKAMLVPILPAMFTDLPTFSIGTPGFHVEIAPECSGYEGMGLILAFSTAWLWFLRRQWRFPNALLLLPAGLAAMFLLNAGRIATLILIGNAGAPGIALGGFHSQAGWLAFNGVALAICVGARRIPWLVRAAPDALVQDAPRDAAVRDSAARDSAARDATTAYLLPFLAILATAMISRSVSGEFEWTYPLRVLAAAGALWYFRDTYKTMNWRVGWPAVLTGVAVFALWMALEPLTHGHATIYGNATGAPSALMNAPGSARVAWIVLRIVGAVVTVPLAEEIAFRGFLLRRIASSDFESVSWQSFAWLPFLISSAAFGLLHGERWLAGTIAGMVYALVTIRRGRIGEAVAAHAITNALLAAWVLITGNWQMW
jgi:exosortase E/protease (VPEID-CTERM system)